jgi:Ca-activated chloride channel family protein
MKTLRLVFALLLFVPTVPAQDEVFKLNVNVDLVEVHVSVVDERDHPVGGLNKENFRVTENRVDQPIAVFKHEDAPVSLGLVLDNSRSIEPRKERLDAAALTFVRQSNPEDETFVVHFDFDARLARDFTANISDLEQTLRSARPFGETALYDAVILAVNHMEKAKYPKKAILLITDGLDNTSQHTLQQALDELKRARVAVYPIGLLSAREGDRAEMALLQVAEASGGKAYFPADVQQARAVIDGIARDLREQYTLGYFPSNPDRNGAWRSIRVDIAPPHGVPQKLRANYKHGYYAPTS